MDAKSKSAALFERALKVLPGGISRNTVLRDPHPAYMASASGCRITDVEGVERIDFSNNMASLIHGHAHPAVVAAVTEQLGKGSACSLATEVELEYAEHLCMRNSGFEKLRFVNSGTEAVMGTLKAARAFTSRPKIAKVEGAYHGQYDYAEASQTAKPSNWGEVDHPASVPVAQGTPEAALADVVIVPYNDPERAVAILNRHASDLACVLLDPMPHRVGLRPANADFIQAMREWTSANGALLVFDEVITFRSEVGGAQTWFECTPDLTALGKAIGGGFPVGAIAGRADVMDVMNPLSKRVLFPHSGTFSANPITMTAGLAAMNLFDADAVARLNTLAQHAMTAIDEMLRSGGHRGCVTGGGSMFRVHLKEHPPLNYRECYLSPEENRQLKILLDHLFDEGLIMINTCTVALSTPMGEEEIDRLVVALQGGFERLA